MLYLLWAIFNILAMLYCCFSSFKTIRLIWEKLGGFPLLAIILMLLCLLNPALTAASKRLPKDTSLPRNSYSELVFVKIDDNLANELVLRVSYTLGDTKFNLQLH